MTTKTLRLIGSITLLLVSLAGRATPYSDIFVFGDSLSDGGNLHLALSSQDPAPGLTPLPIDGNDFIPSLPYDRGTGLLPAMSNGANWIERLSPSLSGKTLLPSLAGGTNHAFAGARMATGSASPVPSVAEQVSGFLTAAMSADPDALYVVWGGGNDARDALVTLSTGGIDAALSIVGAYADALQQAVSGLIVAGARSLLVPTVPDIGKVPAIQALDVAQPGTAAVASSLSAAFLSAYQQVLDGIEALLAPSYDFQLYRLDTYYLMDRVTTDPEAYGLTDASNACAASASCIADPDGYFFWDGIHPTTAGHAIIAAAARRAIPEPPILFLMLGAIPPLWIVRHRRRWSR